MKILVINGSPRAKGNTYKAAVELEKYMKELGEVEFDYLQLSKADLKICIGCFACLSKGGDKCPLKDDRDEIIERMLASDGIVFASPVYLMTITATMKNFFDRFAFTAHRPKFYRQTAMALSTTGAIGLKDTLNYLINAAAIIGCNKGGTLGLETPPGIGNPREKMEENSRKVKKAASVFYNAVKVNKEKGPDFMHLLQFKIQRTIFTMPGGELTSPADHEHYKKLIGKNYYYDTPVNPLFNFVTDLIASFAGLFIKKDFEKAVRDYEKRKQEAKEKAGEEN